MSGGAIAFDLGGQSWTAYGLFDSKGLVRQLTESEAKELAKRYPEVAKLMGLDHQEGGVT